MRLFLALGLALMCLSACQPQAPVCPPVTGTPHFLTIPPEALPTPTPAAEPLPTLVKIGGRSILVDKVVAGPLCNDTWRGSVYVTCNVQVYPHEQDQPLFLKDCDLDIAPDSVVYVAWHNDAPYYKGCSCHTGLTPQP